MPDEEKKKALEHLKALGDHVNAYLVVLESAESPKAQQVQQDLVRAKFFAMSLIGEKSPIPECPEPGKEAEDRGLGDVFRELTEMAAKAQPIVEALARLAAGRKL